MSDFSQRIASLSPERRAQLEQRLLKRGSTSPKPRMISQRERRSPCPLSFAQQRLWFIDQLEPGTPLYNVAHALRMKGTLHVNALRRALNGIVARHEILRTTYGTVDGSPVQIIGERRSIDLPIIDLSQWTTSARETEARRLLTEAARRPFDLSSDLMLRTLLLRLDAEEHILLLMMHHIASDGWSRSVLLRELSVLYAAFIAGKPSPLPDLPIQYADFAVWQRDWLRGGVIEKQLSYWQQKLDGVSPFLELPTDRPRPRTSTSPVAEHSVILPDSLTEAINALSQQERVTRFMTLLAAFKVLLYHYTGRDDILVATPIANRDHIELEGLIGFLVNTLVLRTDLSGDPPFREILARVRRTALDAYAHQDLPFEKVVEVLNPERDLSLPLLTQAAFAYQNVPPPLERFEGLSLNHQHIDTGLAKLDLTFSMREKDGHFIVRVDYNSDLFDAVTIERMAKHFRTLLEGVIANPDGRLSSLSCLTDEERRALSAKRPASKKDVSIARPDDLYNLTNLTMNQFLVWAGQKLQPDVPFYHQPGLYWISGPIDREHFQKAFQALVDRTDALRTVIEERDGIPQQRVLPTLLYPLEYRDFSSEPDPQAAVRTWARERLRTILDLERCLFDSAILKLSEDQFVWYLNLHHLIADGWSFSVILDHLRKLYQGSIEDRLDEVSAFPSFQEYVEVERSYRESAGYLEDEAYWKQKLTPGAEPLAFYGRPPLKPTTRVRRVTYDLGVERTQRLEAIARQEGFACKTLNVSLFNIFVGLLATYLFRISGQRRLFIGAPFLNRPPDRFRETIGLFMQVAPLRISIAEDDRFASLIERVRDESIETLRHAGYTVRNYKSSAYDVILNFHNRRHNDLAGAPVNVEWIHPGHDNYSLSLQVQNPDWASGTYVLHFDFHCDVFPEEWQDISVRHFLHVLDSFLRKPDQPLNRVNLLSTEDEHRLLVELNRTEAPIEENLTVVRLFEEQARDRPDQPAVIHEGRSLTYEQLNGRANQLAHYLRRLGVKPETPVGIFMQRSLEMVTALLGTLKAGGAYVPLDPSYPRERLTFMVEDAQASVIITETSFVQDAPAAEAQIVCLDTDWEKIAQETDVSPSDGSNSENLAYIIYTSGSTGLPKGVLISHRALTNYIRTVGDEFELGPADRVLQFASISFDTSASEIFCCLTRGATLVLRTDSMLDSLPAFLQACRDLRLTILDLPTALWHELAANLTAGEAVIPESVRVVYFGGERAIPERLCDWQKHLSDRVRLVNGYGPTETTIVATIADLTETPVSSAPSSVSIGRPIRNVQAYILDERMGPTAIGIPGELYIGGEGLARGYLNRPDLTAAMFVPDPFGRKAGSRLYRTGDLARYRPDGNIEMLGRIDNQVKIRGFRVEPGEVQSVLESHPAVREAAVIMQEDDGEKRLIAYIVPVRKPAPPTGEWRRFLLQKLPEYMAPSVFVPLDALPRMVNGKLDRQALPQPTPRARGLEEPIIPPRTPLEEAVANIWAEILKLERIGIHDNFFDLGGHSLLAFQIISRLRDGLKMELPLRSLFETPTVAGLAEYIETIQRNQQDPPKNGPANNREEGEL